VRQLRILHLSDIHFGEKHRCDPEDPTHPRVGYPSLFDLIQKDLGDDLFAHQTWRSGSNGSSNHLLVMVTGDLTERATPQEFKSAYTFLKKFDGAQILGSQTSLKDLFVVPGNHDVVYDTEDIETRLTPFANFYSKLFSGTRSPIFPYDAQNLTQVHISDKHSYIVAEIDSAAYVKKGTADAQRGMVDFEAIAKIDTELRAIPIPKRDSMIRIAIIHHHPILVPELVEPERGYDAVANSNHLLKLLREHGFQLVLHGHKHYPNIFSYDSDSPWQERTSPSMLVVSGGSSASRELPSGKRRHNTYNLLSIKWHPEVSQARVRIVTRGLVAEDGGGSLAPHQWKWITLREVDRRLYTPLDPPMPVHHLPTRKFNAQVDGVAEAKRSAIYQETRCNMVVSDVLPSLIPGQAYEVRCWIVPHVDRDGHPKPGWEPPVRVIWSAGERFPVKECDRAADPQFCCALNYWGPMLVQAEMVFANGERAYAQTYARIPGLGR
jgi:3',5'-cyclic AMP phosphodiesterase CpdA